MALPPAQTWTRRGRSHQVPVPARWGSAGRLHCLGTLRVCGQEQVLEYRLLEGACTSTALIAYLDALVDQTAPDRPTVVVLDNAGPHVAKAVQQRQEVWEGRGLRLWYLPPYCPHLNLVERWWGKLKGFLLPRRSYASLAAIQAAVLAALEALGAIPL